MRGRSALAILLAILICVPVVGGTNASTSMEEEEVMDPCMEDPEQPCANQTVLYLWSNGQSTFWSHFNANDTDNANNTDNAENELLNRFNQLLREDPIENILFPPLINQPNPINIQSFNIHQMIDDVIEQEEDRQLQEAIRSSLENN